MSHKACNFYNTPEGCRRGATCQFLHSGSGGKSSSPSRRGPPHRNNSRSVSAPKGICNFFWASGECRNEFTCRFRHEMNSTNTTARSAQSSASALDTIAPFLTAAGLTKVTGTGTDVFFSSNPSSQHSPTQAHNHLKRFLQDDFRFKSSVEVYAFLAPISSANTTNSLWTPEDGQLLLSSIADGNALLRIGDIIRWSPVSIRAGSSLTILSFQRGFLPLLRYLSSDFVVKSTLSHLVNALYMRIIENFESFTKTIEGCMGDIITAGSFKDPQMVALKDPIGSQVIASLAGVFYECLTRFKNLVATEPRLTFIVRSLRGWVEVWIKGVSSSPPTFDDPFKGLSAPARDHIISHLTNKINRLVAIVDREQTKLDRSLQSDRSRLLPRVTGGFNDGIIAALHTTYEGPGKQRQEGPRHDNDFDCIQHIRIAPTHEELISRVPPFLPATLYGAPHPLPEESMERLLDTQFRLLREELTAPLRASIQLVYDDLRHPRQKTHLSDLISKRGGKYHGHTDGQESIMFNVYTNVNFSVLVPDRRGMSVGLSLDAPPGRARSPQAKARGDYWDAMSGKRLGQGGLIAVIWKSGAEISVHLGTLASSPRDLVDSAKRNREQVEVRVVFFDPSVELRILNAQRRPENQRGMTKVLVEATVMFEAIRPFLEALRVEPEFIPFDKYIVPRPPGFFDSFKIDPPKYSVVPGFSYQLSSLFPEEAGIQDLKMTVTNPASVEAARQELRRSRLDPSQADAIVDALTRELALIQGPPGTGKSYTGVELIRVLLKNRIKPILMIAFTNHALDHLLCSVLDAGVTSKIVRLGSRSSDERISQYSIENLEQVAGKSRLDPSFGRYYRALKDVEEEIKKLMNQFRKTWVNSDQIVQYMEVQYPEHYEHILQPPEWICLMKSLSLGDDDDGWHRAGRNGRTELDDHSMYAYWRSGRDLDFLAMFQNLPSASQSQLTEEQPAQQNSFGLLADNATDSDESCGSLSDGSLSGEESDADDDLPEERWKHDWAARPPNGGGTVVLGLSNLKTIITSLSPQKQAPKQAPTIEPSDLQNPAEFFAHFGFDGVPSMPSSDRPLDILLSFGNMWLMSQSERTKLHFYWTDLVRTNLQQNQIEEFEQLRGKHATALRKYNEGKDEKRRQLLQNVDIIGCTTTGASKLMSLLKGVAPRVMLLEEAGQIFEAHVLGSLVPSIEHLILIGDPLQLRPTLNNYSLSVDSRRGQLYKFDMSLMERLATSGLHMSRLDVQRRMRPTISNLIRETLYPGLEDHELVKSYPPVRGFVKNVFFLSHNHQENDGAEESASKYNTFEVGMIKDLVLYFLRQGCYSQEGDIVVLCAYLGQLARVRDALAAEVAVVIDDRDQAALAQHDIDGENALDDHLGIERIQVTKRVRLRTVDNYQGEEAKIVILSLVRNSGASDDEAQVLGPSRANIGFLKSENRTNVALSRAREGLFILGNHLNLASRSPMWRSVIDQLKVQKAVGNAFPVVCHQHPNAVKYVSKPGELPAISPDGGCLLPCDSRLTCGHRCPYKCHPDDPRHAAVTCPQPCRKLCSRQHPCHRDCAEECGHCLFPVADIELPCGHTKSAVSCYLMDDLTEVYCDIIMTKQLTKCEHYAELKCSADPAQHPCSTLCGGIMPCCGRDCNSRCHSCQGMNETAVGSIPRVAHAQHSCQKTLYCGHQCQKPCSEEHTCTAVCKHPCRQECSHALCKNDCSTPCAPCQEPCTWNCAHHKCLVPCGSVCMRLPCDDRCEKFLQCGHKCPSVCGEDCRIQICPLCASADTKESIVDLIMHRTLEDVNSDEGSLDELVITLPKCRHVFTVETLDGICSMDEYYSKAGDGRWSGLEAPSHNFKKPPACPTCRSAITSPRYGRVFKRADLDILELNVAARMSQSLIKVQSSVQSLSKAEMEGTLVKEGGTINVADGPHPKALKARNKAQSAILDEPRDLPVPADALNPGNGKYHSVSPVVVAVWRKATKRLHNIYEQTRTISKTRSAHLNAWESAFSCLYQQEMDLAMTDPSRAPRRPREHSMRVAKMRVGQPKPRADKKFLVESFWWSLNLRFTLADLARTWLKSVGDNTTYPVQQRQEWASYGLFVLKTSVQDARIAFNIAEDSESRRQMTKSSLFIMRAELEQFRFNIEVLQQSGGIKQERDSLASIASQKAMDAREYRAETRKAHILALRSDGECQWLEENFADPAGTIADEWRKIERTIRMDTFYESVSLNEKLSIVKALDFSHTGHFYNCPNGHAFVIGECGGAMERSVCPECGAPIGGSRHVLESTNTRATELENLAQQHGAQPSPWRWGN